MSFHVLDTGALFLLHNKYRPRLMTELRSLPPGDTVLIPSFVMAEANQAQTLHAKRLEAILDFAEVVESLPVEAAVRAARALREVEREKCAECGAFAGPSLIDALVMGLADHFGNREPVVVYTGDLGDMEALRAHGFTGVSVRGLT